MNVTKDVLTIKERGTTDRKVPNGWAGMYSGYEVTFEDGAFFTVDRGIRGSVEVTASNEDGDTLTIWVKS